MAAADACPGFPTDIKAAFLSPLPSRSSAYVGASFLTFNLFKTLNQSLEHPSGQKMLEMVLEPRGDCLKLWVIKSRSCFRHPLRSHIGDALWNSEPDSRHNSHSAFGQHFWYSGKCVFGARGKRRGFSPGAAACHSQHARAHTEFFPKKHFFFSLIRVQDRLDRLDRLNPKVQNVSSAGWTQIVKKNCVQPAEPQFFLKKHESIRLN